MTAPAPAPLVRRLVPATAVPLALLASFLSGAPWLRAFPADVMAVPLVGAALLSVLLPVVVVAIGVRRLWLTALIDLLVFVFFALLVGLRRPSGLADLWDGLVHGPAAILTYALPLATPRTLLIAPLALVWLCGAVLGECVGRGWRTSAPFLTTLVVFGLAYAATVRAVTNPGDGRRYDTLLAAALLVVLLLLRAVQSWVSQDESAEAAQADGALPLRGLAAGATVSVVVAVVAALVVQTGPFGGTPVTPRRVPPLDRSDPLTPVAFVAGLRPEDPRRSGAPLFTVTTSRTSSRYVAVADLDTYDGDSWSFDRQFRPTGGVLPEDPDPTLRPTGAPVVQRYHLDDGPLTAAPWLPYLPRPLEVDGTSVDVDPASGMVVASARGRSATTYTVTSASPAASFATLPADAAPATSAPPSATALPGTVRSSIGSIVTALQRETATTGAPPLSFLQAVQKDFRANYALSGGPAATTSRTAATASAPTTPAVSVTGQRGTPTPTTPVSSPPRAEDQPRAGGNAFATVLASILGPNRTATPEQYATLVALLARAQGVPARLVTGFRIAGGGTSDDGDRVPAGSYRVTTGQAWTWVEIPVAGRGWVVLDASPTTFSGRRTTASGTPRPTPTSSPSSASNALVTQDPGDRGNAVAPVSDVPSHRPPAQRVALVVVLVLAGLVIVGLLALVARKRRRTARRRRPADPRLRLIGAWQEALDVLAESGLSDVRTLTGTEVAAATAQRFGPEPGEDAHRLGRSADVAIFDPAAVVMPHEADEAWTTQVRLRREVRRRLNVRDRLRADLRYHRAPRSPRAARRPGRHR